MAHHTPGRWMATVGNRGTLCVISDDAWICGELSNGNGERPGEAEANARLIAAAPDMLDAVKDYAGVLDFYIRKDERNGDLEGAALKRLTLSRVDAIISKAEGRS